MTVQIRNPHLERQLLAESNRRGNTTKSKTLVELAIERLSQIEVERRTPTTNQKSTNHD